VKLLGTWLQGDRAASFCRLLGRNTVKQKPGHLAGGASHISLRSLTSLHGGFRILFLMIAGLVCSRDVAPPYPGAPQLCKGGHIR
jgi:hypothetical protein